MPYRPPIIHDQHVAVEKKMWDDIVILIHYLYLEMPNNARVFKKAKEIDNLICDFAP